MSSVTTNFITSGAPTFISANSGVIAWDIQGNTKYIQMTIPRGDRWVILSKNQYYTGNGGDAATLNGYPGSYYLDLTNATNLLPYTQVSGLATVAHTGDYADLLNPIQLTTTGSSGPSTLIGNTLNIPQYSGGGGGGVTDVTGSAPIASSGGTTPDISISKADTSTDGYLSSTDWNTFNNKQNSLGFTPVPNTRLINTTAPLTGGGDLSADRTLAIPAANGSTNGYLSSADWTTFNNKGSGTVTNVTASSPVVSSGGATPDISIPVATSLVNGYLSSTDWNTFNSKQAALGFTPEDVANKSTNTSLGTSNTLYPSQNAVKTYVDTQVATTPTVNKLMMAALM